MDTEADLEHVRLTHRPAQSREEKHSRVKKTRGLCVLQVEFHHMGTYKLKGVMGEQIVFQINSSTFSERVFPKKAASSKAELVRPYCNILQPVLLHSSLPCCTDSRQ